MTKRTTHYDTLKIARDAPAEVVRAAYKAMALKYHPDTNKGPKAHEHMESINAAYAILSTAVRRELYDQQLRQQDSVHAQSSTKHANQDASSSKDTNHTQQDQGKDTSSNYSGQKSHGNSSVQKSRETFTGIIAVGLIFTALLIVYSNQTKVVASYLEGGQYRSSKSFFPKPQYELLSDSIGFTDQYLTGGAGNKVTGGARNIIDRTRSGTAAFAKDMSLTPSPFFLEMDRSAARDAKLRSLEFQKLLSSIEEHSKYLTNNKTD